MKIAVIQLGYDDRESVAERTERVVGLVRQQSGHDLIVLPELWPMGGFDYRAWDAKAESVDGSVRQALAAAAREVGAMVHAGSIVERSQEAGPEGKHLWNTALVLDAHGELVTSYRKIHRFGFAAGESVLMEAGESLQYADLPHGFRAGLATCYDLRFPEFFRAQVEAGATAFVVSAAWPMARVEQWRVLLRARAVEDQCLVIACNTAGTHARSEMGGHSAVISPVGEVLAEAGADEQVLSVEVADDVVATAREAFPVLKDRRL